MTPSAVLSAYVRKYVHERLYCTAPSYVRVILETHKKTVHLLAFGNVIHGMSLQRSNSTTRVRA